MKKVVARFVGAGMSLTLLSQFVHSAIAQTSATSSASKGGTSSSLPTAGNTEVTYLIFGLGVALFVVGMMKLVRNLRD